MLSCPFAHLFYLPGRVRPVVSTAIVGVRAREDNPSKARLAWDVNISSRFINPPRPCKTHKAIKCIPAEEEVELKNTYAVTISSYYNSNAQCFRMIVSL